MPYNLDSLKIKRYNLKMKKIFATTLILSSIYSSTLDLGIGVGDMSYPDYLGSNHTNRTILPFPYIDYHSKKIDIDQDGLKERLFSIDELRLRLSMSGSLPVRSSGAREGMDNLDISGEIGPAIIYELYKKDGITLKLDFPIRAVISTNFKEMRYRGYKYDPKLAIDYNFLDGYIFQFKTGGVWADSRFQNYIYGVEREFVTENRAKYKAKAGYMGYKTSIGISKKFNRVWAGASIIYYDLDGAVSKDSPLFNKNYGVYSGLFIAYLFDEKFYKNIKNLFKD